MIAHNLTVSKNHSWGELSEYTFGGTPILAGFATTQEVIPMRPLCENLGIDYSNHRKRVENDPVLSQLWYKEKVYTHGKMREMTCFSFVGLQEWLWSLTPTPENKLAAEHINLTLLEEYKKGLVLYLIQALGVTLAEVLRLRAENETIARNHQELIEKVREMIEADDNGKIHAREAKESFKKAKNLKEQVLLFINGGQLPILWVEAK